MNETYVTIKGRLTADPTVRTTRTGAPMTTFRIAHSARRQVQGQPGQWEDTEASFYDVVTFRSLAANIAVSLRRGHPVTVHGKQRITSWQGDDGSTRTNVEIEADAVGHDLTFGTTAFARVGLGRPAESWSAGEGGEQQPSRPGEGRDPGPLGDQDSDPYVVDGGLGRRMGEAGVGGAGVGGAGVGEAGVGAAGDAVTGGDGTAEPATDTGPLVRPRKGAAA